MLSPQEYYKKVYPYLSKTNEALSYVAIKSRSFQKEYDKKCAEIDKKYEGELEKAERPMLKINAFVNIAKSRTSNLIKSEKPIPYDSGALARLQVQISGSHNDPFAAKLYTEATGQLLFLEQQKDKIRQRCEQEKQQFLKFYKDSHNGLKVNYEKTCVLLNNFFNSNDALLALESLIKKDGALFGNIADSVSSDDKPYGTVSMGCAKMPVPPQSEIVSGFSKKFGNYFDATAKTLSIPVSVQIDKGGVFVAEYSNSNEAVLLSGIRNFILNIAKYHDYLFDRVCFIDPVRFSNHTLGCLEPLVEGDNSFIDPVPLSKEDMRKKIRNIIDVEVDEERVSAGNFGKKLYVFHDFPQSYDTEMISKIQQLCVNAEHYEAIVILTHNVTGERSISNETLTYIKSLATNITCNGQDFMMKAFDNKDCPFKWYEEPRTLPEDVVRKLITSRPVIDKSNDYIKRIGFNGAPKYRKGVRRIENIPYGIDKDGNILYLDFENTNFATFICGASRSGKSTLLHTLITGILKQNHPDDIEMWLIDFKMTEFSQYTKHLPPHVRYIILDESPELVYDIIDRLTEIMQKRQNIFKGKWEKLDHVPPERYMPAMFIIIDEFSVMSNIIADSILSSKDNYVIKMQTLLAKGAALGMHFIFASQGFTTGTRGLNEFSKKQIQQRIAMKTDFGEIKETLDLRTTSDADKALMEQLPAHHALIRIPEDAKGNHLKLAQVIYISDYDEQKQLISDINNNIKAKPKYDVTDVTAYIDKKSMVIDGNSYASYADKQILFKEYLDKNSFEYEDDEIIAMIIGEPQRMMPIYPIEIANGFCENVLFVAPINEKAACTSMILTASKSLRLNNTEIECWTTRKNQIYSQIASDCNFRYDNRATTIEDICRNIKSIKEAIMQKRPANKMIFLFGFESILMDMSYASQITPSGEKTQKYNVMVDSEFTKISRDDDEMDLNTLLDSLSNDDIANLSIFSSMSVKVKEDPSSETIDSGIYDAREDLKYILTHGPRQGYHFAMVYNTIGEFEQSKIPSSLFKHKILFRTSKSDASALVSTACAGIISELKDHVCRYTDGLSEISFRPYLHNGISLDGWTLVDGEVGNIIDEEDYLL